MSPATRKAPGVEQWVPASPTVDALRTAVQDCRGCELYEDATQTVMGDGPRDARLVVVGEQPGDSEDIAGKPFVGPAGQLLVRAIGEARIEPETVWRTNAVKHFRYHRGGKRRIHDSPGVTHIRTAASCCRGRTTSTPARARRSGRWRTSGRHTFRGL